MEPAKNDPSRRAALTAEIAQRTGIDDAMIGRLVRSFYGEVERDPALGPIFAARIRDWDRHIAKMCDFWSSVALLSGRYHGQPMQAHLSLPVDAGHFARWLQIFEATARRVCPPAAAEHFLERARRIAESLELGIAVRRGEVPPVRRPARGAAPDPVTEGVNP
ncbi:MAG: group III truncated hemoglobin [Pseudomonadota bacterium]